jgi:pseudaminic acid cytidylyltransferase
MNIAIIPARGGSKRIPRKNIRDFEGKPIIVYSIETALVSALFNRVVVSTDDDEIGQIAAAYGADVLHRPAKLADDNTGTQEVIRHACIHLTLNQQDLVCGIYPTAPMMIAGDLLRGMQEVANMEAHFAFSVGTDPLHDAGQFYWGRVRSFIDRLPLYTERAAMIPINNMRVCDINTEEDWQWALAQYRRNKKLTGQASKEPSTTPAKRSRTKRT